MTGELRFCATAWESVCQRLGGHCGALSGTTAGLPSGRAPQAGGGHDRLNRWREVVHRAVTTGYRLGTTSDMQVAV